MQRIINTTQWHKISIYHRFGDALNNTVIVPINALNNIGNNTTHLER